MRPSPTAAAGRTVKDALGRIQTVIVLGGGSDIAFATLEALLADGPLRVVQGVRDPDSLDVARLASVGASGEKVAFDARADETHASVLEHAFALIGDVDLVLLAFGLLGDQQHDERDGATAVEVTETNYVGAVSALTKTVELLRRQGHGAIVVLSSIAGQRARRSNYVYGAAKAGLDAFAQGLQLALAGEDVRLMIVRPGFVTTSMTAHLPRAPLAVSADDVASAVKAGLVSGADVVWVPGKLRWAALLLRALPAAILRRL